MVNFTKAKKITLNYENKIISTNKTAAQTILSSFTIVSIITERFKFFIFVYQHTQLSYWYGVHRKLVVMFIIFTEFRYNCYLRPILE